MVFSVVVVLLLLIVAGVVLLVVLCCPYHCAVIDGIKWISVLLGCALSWEPTCSIVMLVLLVSAVR